MRCRALFLLSLYPGILVAQVSYERLARAAREPQNWLMYSGTYMSQRYSALDQIAPGNVKNAGTEVGLSGREPAEIRDHAAGAGRHHVSDPAAQ